MKRMILVAGIHGVGKTTFCDKIVKEFNLLNYSASEIIANKKNEQFSKNKRISEIEKNQELLLEGINELSKKDGRWFLLDGHFCLLNSTGIITKITEETFIKLSPTAIILLIDSIESISERLNHRDNTSYNTNLLKTFQEAEQEYSKKIAENLSIPYFVFKNGDELEKLSIFINNLLN